MSSTYTLKNNTVNTFCKIMIWWPIRYLVYHTAIKHQHVNSQFNIISLRNSDTMIFIIYHSHVFISMSWHDVIKYLNLFFINISQFCKLQTDNFLLFDFIKATSSWNSFEGQSYVLIINIIECLFIFTLLVVKSRYYT